MGIGNRPTPEELREQAEQAEQAVNKMLDEMMAPTIEKVTAARKKYAALLSRLDHFEFIGLKLALEDEIPVRLARLRLQYPFLPGGDRG